MLKKYDSPSEQYLVLDAAQIIAISWAGNFLHILFAGGGSWLLDILPSATTEDIRSFIDELIRDSRDQ